MSLYDLDFYYRLVEKLAEANAKAAEKVKNGKRI
jgi:hypothetical protein